ncbi:MAG: hypothetical protein G8345_14130, partial [Magnetococcales bacterium]|nr:hypothetical protein [Magnetococcales bacterium]
SLRIHLFVRDPYHRLVTASSRFWNASGFSVNVTPAGVNVKSESVQSLLMGGVAFDTPDVGKGESTLAMDTTFPLLAADPNHAEGGGDLAGLGSRLASILQKVDQLPIQEMGKDMQETLHTLNQTVNAPEVMEALRGMNRALRQSERLLQDLDQQVIPVASGIKSLGQSTTVAMEQANKSLTAMERLLVADSPLHRQTLETLRELAATAYALRTLTNTLQRNPESLLFGKEKGKKP